MDLSQEQREFWQHVGKLWGMAKEGDAVQLRRTLHPRYVGWDMNAAHPHDREAAVLSVSGNAPALLEYELQPLSVQIYEGQVGVAHDTYSARILASNGEALSVTGKWTEVYLKQESGWVMIAVSGRPDEPTKQMPDQSPAEPA